MGRWLRNTQGKLLWIAGGGASLAVVLLSCSTTTTRTIVAPPNIPGAEFVGSGECKQCHEKISRDFRTASHSKLMAKGENAKDAGCESCHGPGSKHVAAGGGAGTIVNPGKSPQACMQCHLDKKAQFSLPYSHPVLAGKMTCADCHDPHKGRAREGNAMSLGGRNEVCQKCHIAQTGPFVFEHAAVREGCVSCHSPHGSMNQKMLNERSANLCLKCHFQDNRAIGGQSAANDIFFGPSGGHKGNINRGACWSAGCHEAVHGSNVNAALRF